MMGHRIEPSWCDGSSDQALMVDPLSYFLFQPVLYDWCNKGHGMYYPVCGMVHIKDPLLLIEKSNPSGGHSLYPLSLFVWSFAIYPTAKLRIKKTCCSISKLTHCIMHTSLVLLRGHKTCVGLELQRTFTKLARRGHLVCYILLQPNP